MWLAVGVGIVCGIGGYLFGIAYGCWLSRKVIFDLMRELDESKEEKRRFKEIRDKVYGPYGRDW